MTITNLQSWADNLQIIWIPDVDQDISVLQGQQTQTDTLLSTKIQQFSDQLSAHSTALSSLTSSVTAAQNSATQANTQLASLDQTLRNYVDSALTDLEGSLGDSLAGAQGTIEGNVTGVVQSALDSISPNLTAVINAAKAEITALQTELLGQIADFEGTAGDILNDTLPKLTTLQVEVMDALEGFTGSYDNFLSDYDDPDLMTTLGKIQAKQEADLAPMGGAVLRAPASFWSDTSTLVYDNAAGALTLTRIPFTNGSFIKDDASFGECFEFTSPTTGSIGPAYPVDFDAERVYKITVKFRVISDGVGNLGAGASVGIATATGTTLVQNNLNRVLESGRKYKVADGVITQSIYVSVNADKMSKYGIDLPTKAINPSGSSLANKLYFYLRQNPTSTATVGKIRLASTYITDVTEALDGVNAVSLVVEGLDTRVTNDYFTVEEMDSVFAGAETTLTATKEEFKARLKQRYFTIADLNNAFSVSETGLSSEAEDFRAVVQQNFYTQASADEAITNEVTSQVSSLNLPAIESAVISGGFSQIKQPLTVWTSQLTTVGSFPRPALNEGFTVLGDPVFGDCYQSTTANVTVGLARGVPYDPNKVYLMRVRFKVTSDGSLAGVKMGFGASSFSGDGLTVYDSNRQTTVSTPYTVADGVQELKVCISAKTVDAGFYDVKVNMTSASDLATLIMFHVRSNASGDTNGVVRIGLMEIRDITEVIDSWANSQVALVESTAATSAKDGAVAARTVAATLVGQGTGLLRDQFLPFDSSNWVTVTTAPIVTINTYYGMGNTLSWTLATQTAGVRFLKTSALWNGGKNADSYKIELEFELTSGVLEGAGIAVDWCNTAGGVFRTLYRLDAMLSTTLVLGQKILAGILVRKPADFTGTFDGHAIYLGANDTIFGTKTTKSVKFHRFQIYPIDVTTSSVQELIGAGVDASGNAYSNYVLRTKANSEGALFELVSASDPVNGDVSTARIEADYILLDGSVKAKHIQVDNLAALSAILGDVTIENTLQLQAGGAGFIGGRTAVSDYDVDGFLIARTDKGNGVKGFEVSHTSVVGEKLSGIIHRDSTEMEIFNPIFRLGGSIEGGVSTITTTTNIGQTQRIDLTVQGGGGGGGAGKEDNGGTGSAAAGGSTVVKVWAGAVGTGTLLRTVTATGGLGGRNGYTYFTSAHDGEASTFGLGGTGGALNSAGSNAPVGSYGAGGGGGGGDANSRFDTSGYAGEGGRAGQRVAVTVLTEAYANQNIYLEVTRGTGGAGSTSGNYYGGNGTSGAVSYASLLGGTTELELNDLYQKIIPPQTYTAVWDVNSAAGEIKTATVTLPAGWYKVLLNTSLTADASGSNESSGIAYPTSWTVKHFTNGGLVQLFSESFNQNSVPAIRVYNFDGYLYLSGSDYFVINQPYSSDPDAEPSQGSITMSIAGPYGLAMNYLQP